MPKVSVLMPVYNTKEQYLRAAIESIFTQTFTDFELIIVNDGSTNNAATVLAEYAAKDKRIQVITQNNQGLSCARNSGLKVAEGAYIAFLDSDDFYAPDFLKVLFNAAEKTDADITGCDFMKIRRNGDSLPEYRKISEGKVYNNALNTLLHRKNFIHFNVWNKLYKREVIGDIRFIPDMYFEDWVFNCMVFNHANKFVWFKEKLYGYRITENSIMRSGLSLKKIDDYVQGIRTVHSYFGSTYPDKWQKIRHTRVARTIKMLMNNTLRTGDSNLHKYTRTALRQLYEQKLIGYAGLSFFNKLKLFRFLHSGAQK